VRGPPSGYGRHLAVVEGVWTRHVWDLRGIVLDVVGVVAIVVKPEAAAVMANSLQAVAAYDLTPSLACCPARLGTLAAQAEVQKQSRNPTES